MHLTSTSTGSMSKPLNNATTPKGSSCSLNWLLVQLRGRKNLVNTVCKSHAKEHLSLSPNHSTAQNMLLESASSNTVIATLELSRVSSQEMHPLPTQLQQLIEAQCCYLPHHKSVLLVLVTLNKTTGRS